MPRPLAGLLLACAVAAMGWFARALELLGAVPRELGNEVTRSLEGLWWDSRHRLPDPALVQRRNFAIGDPIRPWLAPESALPGGVRRALAEACGGAPAPVVFANPARVPGVELADLSPSRSRSTTRSRSRSPSPPAAANSHSGTSRRSSRWSVRRPSSSSGRARIGRTETPPLRS